jgi:hypothetical protein
METQETPETDEQEQRPEEKGVAIYSKLAILLLSIFFDPIVGGVLLMLNLRSVGYKKEGSTVLLFSIAYYFISGFLISYIANLLRIPLTMETLLKHPDPKIMVSIIVMRIIGGGVLAEYFFKKYFPHDDYEHKSIWKALLVTLLVIIPLSMLVRL